MHTCRHVLSGEVTTPKLNGMRGCPKFRTPKLFYCHEKRTNTNEWRTVQKLRRNPPAKCTRTTSNRCIELLDKCDSDSMYDWGHWCRWKITIWVIDLIREMGKTNTPLVYLRLTAIWSLKFHFAQWLFLPQWISKLTRKLQVYQRKNFFERNTCIKMIVWRGRKMRPGV